MSHQKLTLRQRTLVACSVSACLFTGVGFMTSAHAQSTSADLQAQYRNDIARCNAGQTAQDIKTCKQEAGAAYEEGKRNRLVTNQESALDQNAAARCNPLPEGERQDCLIQMSAQNTKVMGSVEGGGILRQTEITIPANGPSTMGSPSTMPGTLAPTSPNGLSPTSPGLNSPGMSSPVR